jgi:hypothetical protein
MGNRQIFTSSNTAPTTMRGNLSYDRVYLTPDEDSESESSYDRLELVNGAPNFTMAQNLI